MKTIICNNGGGGGNSTGYRAPRLSALLFAILAAALAPSARATIPAATAVWESNFGESVTSSDGNTYTIAPNGNVVTTEGNLRIDNSLNDHLGASITLPATVSAATVLIKYSNLAAYTTANATLASFKSADHVAGARTLQPDSLHVGAYYEGSSSYYQFVSTTPSVATGTGYFILAYTYSNGTMAYAGSTLASATGGNNTSVRWQSFPIASISIGGGLETQRAWPWDGVIIEKVAIFTNGAYTATDLAEWVWPSERKTALSQWLDDGRSVYVWRGATTGTNAGIFHKSNVAKVNADGTLGAETVVEDDSIKWQSFLYGDTDNYTAPGPVLVYDASGYRADADAQFGTMGIGGICVTAPAVEASGETAETPYSITGSSTSGDRTTSLGYVGYETHFKFDKSFTLNRSGAVTFRGTANVSVASGAVFDCNSEQTAASVLASGAVLKLSGEGKMKVGAFAATGGTLDFTGLADRSAALPFIEGPVTVGAGTKIVLPTGAASPYTIATSLTGSLDAGSVTGADGTVYGGATANADGTVSFEAPSEITISETGTTAWPSEWTSATGSYTVNVAANLGDAVTLTALSVSLASGSVTLNVGAGSTLTIDGAISASTIRVTGDGTVKLTAAGSLAGTIIGDGTVLYSGVQPPTGRGWTDATAWTGTLAAENVAKAEWNPNNFGNANSVLRLSSVALYFPNSDTATDTTIDLSGEGMTINDGYGYKTCTIKKLTGGGKLTISSGSQNGNGLIVQNADGFTGAVSVSTWNYLLTFGASGTYATSTTGGKIHVASGASVAIAKNTSWTATNGVVIDGTLTLNEGSGMPVVSSGSGTVVCNKKVPDNTGLAAATWTGTVELNGDVSAASTHLSNAGSTLKIASGAVTLTAATAVPGKVEIASGATLKFTNASATTLSLGCVANDGILDISGMTELTTLNLDIGTERTVSLGTVGSTFNIPSSLSGFAVSVTEAKGDGGTISLSAGSLAVATGATAYTVAKLDGTTATATTTTSDGVVTLTYAPSISGAATMYDVTFKNNETDIGKSGAYSPGTLTYSCGTGALYYDNAAAFNNDAWNDTTGLYARCRPYIDGAASKFNALSDFTAVVVGQMSPTHNTIFIHMGSSYSTYTGLLIATTESDDEVLIAPNTGDKVDTSKAVKVKVPNAAKSRHAYVIVRSGGTFTVWVDGVKRGNFTPDAGFALGVSSHSGVQVGADFGGGIRGNGYDAIADSTDETGVVNVIRIFDYAVSDAQKAAIFAAYPYEPLGGAFSRTVSADGDLSSDGAWTKDGDESGATYALPVGATVDGVEYAPSATITATAAATLSVNAALTLETLTVGGSAALTIEASGANRVTTSSFVADTAVTVKYGAVDLAGTPVAIADGATLTIDCSALDISGYYANNASIQLTGTMDRDDEKFRVSNLPTATGRTASLNYNSDGYYELLIATDHTAGGEVYYKGGYFGQGGDNPFKVVLADGETETAVFPGDTVVIDGKSSQDPVYVGALPANVASISVAKNVGMSSGDAGNAMLDGATVAVASDATLTIQYNYNAINLGSVAFNGGAVVLDANGGGVMTVSGAVTGTAAVTVAAGSTVRVASGGSIVNAVTLAEGATLVVEAGASVAPAPTTNAEGRYVRRAVSSDGSTTYSVSKGWMVIAR